MFKKFKDAKQKTYFDRYTPTSPNKERINSPLKTFPKTETLEKLKMQYELQLIDSDIEKEDNV